uniref:Uncharacterized protein n=1 Tax=Sphaerodactylus townsendi TaxID=933632 RepID=A0ACB8EVK2_9SAUR
MSSALLLGPCWLRRGESKSGGSRSAAQGGHGSRPRKGQAASGGYQAEETQGAERKSAAPTRVDPARCPLRQVQKRKLKDAYFPCSEATGIRSGRKRKLSTRSGDKGGKKIKAGSHKRELQSQASGRKVKLQSKVAVLIREGASSNSPPGVEWTAPSGVLALNCPALQDGRGPTLQVRQAQELIQATNQILHPQQAFNPPWASLLNHRTSPTRSEMHLYLKKLHTQERAVEEVKLAIKPYYQKKEITKDEYKDILRKAVHKICHSKSGEINPVKVNNLVKAYVQRYKYFRKHGRKMDEEPGPPKEMGGLDKSGLPMPPL